VGVPSSRQGAPSARPSWSSSTISLILASGLGLSHWRERPSLAHPHDVTDGVPSRSRDHFVG